MHKEFLMGNEAIALGALAAGVNLAAGYPGTPSTEILETLAKRAPETVHVEWSINEKAGMETAAGAAYSGARALVTMKQVGLNVASDPLMSLEYIGVEGGMVIVVADDPGPISSQTEQDTRTFGMFSKVPVFDPSSVAEAYEMVQEAFELSEKYHTPVFLRPTTRIDHGYEAIDVKDPSEYKGNPPKGFIKDSNRWVIFPKLSVKNHALIEERNAALSKELSRYPRNFVTYGEGAFKNVRKGIATHGISSMYVKDVLGGNNSLPTLHVATPFPFPEDLAVEFLQGLDEVICIEELDPVIERALNYICGKYHLPVNIRGKLTGDVKRAGENSVDYVGEVLAKFIPELCSGSAEALNVATMTNTDTETHTEATVLADGTVNPAENEAAAIPELPVRPPVLCAGCPHRASFYAVKVAMKGKKTIYCGDIGCYTLGNAAPLDMCDTCLCMGAGINIAQGVYHTEPDTKCFAFVGDSTFFASGITGTINACYGQADMTLVVLDNSTTAMTGHQPHPGIGKTIRGKEVPPVSIEKILRAIGLTEVVTMNPFDFKEAVETVKRVADLPGVKAIIFKSPCVTYVKPTAKSHIDGDKCTGCRKCIKSLGCPGLIINEGKAAIDDSQCTGCTLCGQICPVGAISGGEKL